MAVMARLAVTPGAWSRVPISGSTRPGIAGQGTKPVHVSAGTAKSEPHGGVPAGSTVGCTVLPVLGAGWWPGGVPGVRGCKGSARCAHHHGEDGCIYGCRYWARLGQGGAKSGARTSARIVPE